MWKTWNKNVCWKFRMYILLRLPRGESDKNKHIGWREWCTKSHNNYYLTCTALLIGIYIPWNSNWIYLLIYEEVPQGKTIFLSGQPTSVTRNNSQSKFFLTKMPNRCKQGISALRNSKTDISRVVLWCPLPWHLLVSYAIVTTPFLLVSPDLFFSNISPRELWGHAWGALTWSVDPFGLPALGRIHALT